MWWNWSSWAILVGESNPHLILLPLYITELYSVGYKVCPPGRVHRSIWGQVMELWPRDLCLHGPIVQTFFCNEDIQRVKQPWNYCSHDALLLVVQLMIYAYIFTSQNSSVFPLHLAHYD